MSQQEPGPAHAPEFPSNVAWRQDGPLTLRGLRGGPGLLDFWECAHANAECGRRIGLRRDYGPRSQRP
ncbi:MAG: hypothetical protein WEE64_12190 [Dehalococcoidia bacterium]